MRPLSDTNGENTVVGNCAQCGRVMWVGHGPDCPSCKAKDDPVPAVAPDELLGVPVERKPAANGKAKKGK